MPYSPESALLSMYPRAILLKEDTTGILNLTVSSSPYIVKDCLNPFYSLSPYPINANSVTLAVKILVLTTYSTSPLPRPPAIKAGSCD